MLNGYKIVTGYAKSVQAVTFSFLSLYCYVPYYSALQIFESTSPSDFICSSTSLKNSFIYVNCSEFQISVIREGENVS